MLKESELEEEDNNNINYSETKAKNNKTVKFSLNESESVNNTKGNHSITEKLEYLDLSFITEKNIINAKKKNK